MENDARSNETKPARTCPHCGSDEVYYDELFFRNDYELPPKPWYGIDPYSDPAYHGAWMCSSCGNMAE